MADDEQIVVAHAIQHALAGFQRIHHDRPGPHRGTRLWRLAIVGDDAAGAESRGPDVRALELHPQGLHQADRRDLGGRVNTRRNARNDAAHGSGTDDVRALVVLLEMRQTRFDAVVDGGEIHGDRVVPVAAFRQARLGERLGAGVVDQQVQIAELRLDFREQLGPAVTIRHIVFDGVHARVGCLEERERFSEALFSSIPDHNLHARVGAGSRNAKADAVRRRCDVGGLPGNILQRCGLRIFRRDRHSSAGTSRWWSTRARSRRCCRSARCLCTRRARIHS